MKFFLEPAKRGFCKRCFIASWNLVLLTTPQLDFILQIDSVFLLNAFPNLLSQGQSVGLFGIVALGNDKVRVPRGNPCTAAPRALHPQAINHLASADRAGRRIFKEAPGRPCAMRLRRHPLTLGCLHAGGNLLRISLTQQESRAQQQLAVAKRCVAIIPTNLATGNLNYTAAACYSHCFNYGPNFLAVGSRVHPQRPSHSARYPIQSFDPAKTPPPPFNTATMH